MAITITDTRTIPTNGGNTADGDATAGWTGSKTVSLFTSAPSPVEATGCLGMVVSNETADAYFTMGASQNWSAGMLIYIWIFSRGEPDTTANGGIQIQIGDGTNRVGFHVGGSDKAGFRHGSGPARWECFVLDTANLPTQNTVLAGSLASLNLAAITQVGIVFKTVVKAVGGVENMFWDVVRYGNNGLIVTGGTSGDPGTFAQIAADDESTANGKAYGICRKLAEGVFGLQGPLTFGDDAGSSAHYFRDTSATIVFEDRGLTRDKYWLKVVGNATGIGEFSLGTKTGTGDAASGVNGCTLIAPTNAPAYLDASDADLDEFNMYGCTIDGFTMGITLSADATNGPNHEFHGNTVRGCGQVATGRVVCRNNLFTGTKHFKTTADAAIADDGGAFTDETADFASAAAADVQIFPATPVANDAFYFGHVAKFNEITVLVSTASTTGTIVWEYWDGGTWATLTLTSQHTDFSRVGKRIFKFTIPGSWATTTVNSQGPFYYVRARYSVAGAQVVASSGSLFGPPHGSALLWNDNNNVSYCDFTQNTDADNNPHAIEHNTSTTANYSNMNFSGNDFDIEYSVGTASDITINATDSNPSTSEKTEGTTGNVNIVNTVNLTVTVLDKAGSPIQSCQVAIYNSTTGAEYMNEATNASGIATEPYNYTGPTNIRIEVRAIDATATSYKPVTRTGQISAIGFTLTERLEVNEIIN